MIYIYQIITYSRTTLTVIASNSTDRDNIIETCHIEAAIVKEIAKTDNIIISKDFV